MLMPDAFAARKQSGSAQAQFRRELDQPMRQRLAGVPTILLSEEGDLIAVHDVLLMRI